MSIVLAGALLALEDPAHDLLAATPVGSGRRVLHRVLLLTLTTVATIAVVTRSSAGLDISSPVESTSIVALTAVGLATFGVWWRRDHRAAPTVGAAVQLGWSTWAAMTPAGEPLASVAHAVLLDPWPVTASSAMVVSAAHAHRRAVWARS